jgi:hypothetical protein
MGDRTYATVVLHVPEGGIPLGAAVAVGAEHELPDWMLTPQSRQVLLQGGTITIEDQEANYGRVNGWEASEWSTTVGGIDVDATWSQGGEYGPGRECIRGGEVHAFSLIDDEEAITVSGLDCLLKEGKTLEDAIAMLTVPAVAYKVGTLEASINA